MRRIYRTSRFKKDVKKVTKRGKDFNKFKEIIHKLANDIKLEEKHRDHKLIGDYENMRECHIEPEWLLIYQLTENDLTLIRTGTHADLFK
jgi:mRNA interferase YafQ